MKTLHKLAPLAMLGAFATHACAQSSITLYGLISAGVGYATNQGGKNAWQALSGTNQNPRWGLKGKEDLGQGLSAIFQLENGFNVMTGTAAQNGREFGRLAYVGLADRTYGSLTFGRQYDAIHDYIGPVIIASNGVNIGDNDNGYNDIRVQNSVKYVSPVYYGLKFTALYGFSNATGFANNSAYSFGLGYERGPLRWSAVYAQYNHPYSGSNPDGAIANDYASPLLIFAKSATGPDKAFVAACAGATLVLSWLVLQSVFVLHYAHRHFGDGKSKGGIQFPGEPPTSYMDFAYLAFSVGATFQVSDNSILTAKLRRLVTAHAATAYFYNTAILALGINIIASLVGG